MSGPLSRARETLKNALEQYISLLGVDAPSMMMEDSKRIVADRMSAQKNLVKSLMRSSTSSAGGRIASPAAAAPVAVSVATAVLQETAPASTPAMGGAGAPAASTSAASDLEGWITPPMRGKPFTFPTAWGDVPKPSSPPQKKTFASAAAAAAPLVAKSTGGTKPSTSWKDAVALHFTDYKSTHLGFKNKFGNILRVLERCPLSKMHDSVFQTEDGFEDHINGLSDEKFEALLKDTSSAGPIVTKSL